MAFTKDRSIMTRNAVLKSGIPIPPRVFVMMKKMLTSKIK